jgi:hypothetical protein
MKVDEFQYSDDEEFVENVERMELDENSEPESDEGGAEVSFVSMALRWLQVHLKSVDFKGALTYLQNRVITRW